MGKRRFMYYGSILGMSITFAMFSVMEAFLIWLWFTAGVNAFTA